MWFRLCEIKKYFLPLRKAPYLGVEWTRVHAEGWRGAAYPVRLRGPRPQGRALTSAVSLCVCARVGRWVLESLRNGVHYRLSTKALALQPMFRLEDTIRTCSLDNEEYKQWYNLGENFGNLERKWPLGWDSPSLQDETLHPLVWWPDPWKPLIHPGHVLSSVKWDNSWSLAHEMKLRSGRGECSFFPGRTGWFDQVDHHLGKGLTMLVRMWCVCWHRSNFSRKYGSPT